MKKNNLLSQRMSVKVEKQERSNPRIKNEKKHEKEPEFQFNTPASNINTSDSLFHVDGTDEMEKSYHYEKRKKILAFVSMGLASLFVVYVCFLIFGVFLTKYTYNNLGEVVPIVLSVEEIRELKEFETLNSFYLRTRALYETVLKTDHELDLNPDRALTIAMEYTEELEVLDKIITDLKAAEYSPGYAAMYDQIYTYLSTEFAWYLQKKATAITNNSAADAGDAEILRETIKSDFALITSNIAKLANSTKGASVEGLYDWTPDQFSKTLGEEVSH